MKIKIRKTILILITAGIIASPVVSAKQDSLQASVKKLEKEVANLKYQVNANKETGHFHPNYETAKSTIPDIKAVELGEQPGHLLPYDLDLPGKAIVSTGPYVGIKVSYSGSNLIINSPSVNTDLQLLELRKKIIKRLAVLTGGLPTPDHSHLLFSGIIESQAIYFKPGGHDQHSTTDIDLTNVSIDATLFGPTNWMLGFIDLTYDAAPPNGSVFSSSSNYRVGNSRVYVNKAFVTLGDLNCAPFYATFGQFYVPFGRYSSVMVSNTLTLDLARTKARAILLGYSQQADNSFYASTYIFRGDSHRGSTPKINNGGLNAGFKFSRNGISGDIGAGVIGNIADSGGMQTRVGFQTHERIKRRVPAYDLRAVLNIGTHIDLIGEYIFASSFNAADMTYNGENAKPHAFDLEASYSFTMFNDKPTAIGIGYGKSNEALALGIPLTRTSLVFNISLLPDTLQSLEFRRDRQYSSHDVATGAGGVASAADTGKIDNAVTLQFDFYF